MADWDNHVWDDSGNYMETPGFRYNMSDVLLMIEREIFRYACKLDTVCDKL